MFTGLVETVGRLARLETAEAGGMRITVRHGGFSPALEPGESIAVHGACLTVAEAGPEYFCCDLLEETLRCTCLARKKNGSLLNLERALRIGDRLGGHILSGHVDCVGRIVAIRPVGRDKVLTVGGLGDAAKTIVNKGSVAVDGVSLTVAGLRGDSFEAHLIPFTWDNTAFQEAAVGQEVNIETDILAKYVQKLLGLKPEPGLTAEQLRDAGFV